MSKTSAAASFIPINSASSGNPQRVNQFIQRARLAKTATEIGAAIEEASQLGRLVKGELADAKAALGQKLLDLTPDDAEEHNRVVRALHFETEQLDAILDTLRKRLAEAEQCEELAAGDAKIQRCVELAKAGRRAEASYEMNAKKVATDLSNLTAASDEFRRLDRELERLGRSADLGLAIAPEGGPPGAVKGVGLLHDTSDLLQPVVRLPAVTREGMIWGRG